MSLAHHKNIPSAFLLRPQKIKEGTRTAAYLRAVQIDDIPLDLQIKEESEPLEILTVYFAADTYSKVIVAYTWSVTPLKS